MTTAQMHLFCRWVEAQTAMWIWNPELWCFHPNKETKARKQLFYRAKGVVLHDRLLNERL